MTPEQANVAFMLDGIPGVLGVYALAKDVNAQGDIEYVVEIEQHAGRALARATYALLRIMSHEQVARVALLQFVSGRMLARATELRLSARDREQAGVRLASLLRTHEEENALTQQKREENEEAARAAGVLVVDDDADLIAAILTAFPGVNCVIEPNPQRAVDRARERPKVILCNARRAFGANGFLAELARSSPAMASRVVLTLREGEIELARDGLAERGIERSLLVKPIDVEFVRLLLYGYTMPGKAPHVVPFADTLSIQSPASRNEARHSPPRVLIVDDDLDASLLVTRAAPSLAVLVTDDTWRALDEVMREEWDLVLCNATMKTVGDLPLYRFLWNARPDLKARCALIVAEHAVPASVREGRASTAIARPIAPKIAALLAPNKV